LQLSPAADTLRPRWRAAEGRGIAPDLLNQEWRQTLDPAALD
jgi:hypothetical protein